MGAGAPGVLAFRSLWTGGRAGRKPNVCLFLMCCHHSVCEGLEGGPQGQGLCGLAPGRALPCLLQPWAWQEGGALLSWFLFLFGYQSSVSSHVSSYSTEESDPENHPKVCLPVAWLSCLKLDFYLKKIKF